MVGYLTEKTVQLVVDGKKIDYKFPEAILKKLGGGTMVAGPASKGHPNGIMTVDLHFLKDAELAAQFKEKGFVLVAMPKSEINVHSIAPGH
jgi:hypothetical protein